MTRFYHRLTPLLRSFSENINTSFLALIAGIIITAYSCEEDPTTIGNRLLPGSDFVSIKSTDTISVRSYTMYTDSVQSDNPSLSYLGTVYDPYFGTTTAEFVTEIRLGSAWDNTFMGVDSVKLFLDLLSVTGDTVNSHTIRISEISERLLDTTYYSNKSVPLTGSSWTFTLPGNLRSDTINSVEIDIDTLFGDYLIRDTTQFKYPSAKQKTIDFRSYFKGLYFQMVPTSPLLASLRIASSGSLGSYSNYFVLYGHDTSGNPINYALIIDAVSGNISFNRFARDFETAIPEKKIPHINDTTILDTLSYIQTLGGVYTKLIIPGLEDIKNDPSMDNISVNRARLIFPIHYDGSLYKPSTVPSQVYMNYVSTTGIKEYVQDLKLVSPAFFDGVSDTTNNDYSLNIATFVQEYLQDTKNYFKPELDIVLPSNASKNLILKANSSHTPVKFEFTYTRF